MKKKEVLVCESCDNEIERVEDGLVIQGNIYVAEFIDGNLCSGLIGSSQPERMESSLHEVEKQAFHWECFFDAFSDETLQSVFSTLTGKLK